MKKGIDISYWQGKVDFSKVKNSGIEFVILREGYGKDVVDKRFYEYVEGCRKAGLDIPGVYHFSYAKTVEDARKEAEYTIDHIRTAGLAGDKPLVFYDFEYDTVNSAAKQGVALLPKHCDAFANAFCEEVARSGFTAGIYLNIDYYRNWYQKDTLSKYQIWLADYTGKPDYDCTFQQYTSGGSVPGISVKVDMNYWFDDVPIAITPENTKKTVSDIAREVIQGIWGAGEQRKIRLESAGFNYNEVQAEVNRILAPPKKGIDEIAREVIQGKWGSGQNRIYALSRAGYDYETVQRRVNALLKGQ